MTKISETLSLAGGNLARPTRFSVLIAPPPEVVPSSMKIFDVLCKDIKVPDVTMEPIEVVQKGHTIKVPSRVNQDQTLEVTMYLDEYHTLRQMFNDWISGLDNRFYAVSSPAGANIQKSYNYFGNLIIKTRDFNETTAEPMNYLFEGIYPISVGGPSFASSGQGEITELTVTFAYMRFISGDEAGDFDSLDEYLDVFGLSAADIGGLGFIGNTIGSIGKAWNSVQGAMGAVGGLF